MEGWPRCTNHADQYVPNARLRNLIFAWANVTKAGNVGCGDVQWSKEVPILSEARLLPMQREGNVRLGRSYSSLAGLGACKIVYKSYSEMHYSYEAMEIDITTSANCNGRQDHQAICVYTNY